MTSRVRTITDFATQADQLRAARFGTIEVSQGRLVKIKLRRWPKMVSVFDIAVWGRRYHGSKRGDRCLLYYDQPREFPNFLTLKYLVSTRDCAFGTVRTALAALDEVARLKGTDALLCDAWNWRISDRMLQRHGWQPHAPSRWHRNFIKRFYGSYPATGLGSAMTNPLILPFTETTLPYTAQPDALA